MAAPSLSAFLSQWATIADLGSVTALLQWDQETGLPEKGAGARGQALSTLAALRHEKITSEALYDALQAAEADDQDEVGKGQLRQARREIEQARLIPKRLATALAECDSRNLHLWQKARAENSFGLFSEGLEESVALNRERAACLSPNGDAYDAMLNLYEPGVTAADLVPVFEELEGVLVPLLREVADSKIVVDESPAQGHFDVGAQRDFAMMVAKQMGYSFAAGRLDATAHPFCTTIGANDIRITWRHQEDDFRPALYGIMHEAGHGLYEQGLPQEWARTPLFQASGLGMHESQSRLWENLVGRSEAFWDWAMPHFHQAFPEKRGLTPAELYPSLHTCRPSFIRVEADEATYNLHIAARFHIERALFAREVDVAELPELWDDTYERLLGIRPKDAAEGVLQDIHWAMGAFGYFPTYTLGNLIASQLFEQAERELGPQEEAFRQGELAPLRAWLLRKVHSQGCLKDTRSLVKDICGEGIQAAPLLRSLSHSLERVYGIRVGVGKA